MRIKFEIELGAKKDANSAKNVPASEHCEKICVEDGQEAASKKKSDNFIAPFWKAAKTPLKAALYCFGIILCLGFAHYPFSRSWLHGNASCFICKFSRDSYVFLSALSVAVAVLIPCAVFIFATPTRKRVPDQTSVEKAEHVRSVVANLLIVLSVLVLVCIAILLAVSH